MEPIVIIVLVIVIGLLAGLIAWFGPRQRHWRVHDEEDDRPESDRGERSSG